MFTITSDVYYLVMISGAAVTAVWGLAMWLTKQFSTLKGQLYDKIDKSVGMILDKLEYHERHDDQRFAALGQDLTDLRIRNATADALLLRKHPSKD